MISLFFFILFLCGFTHICHWFRSGTWGIYWHFSECWTLGNLLSLCLEVSQKFAWKGNTKISDKYWNELLWKSSIRAFSHLFVKSCKPWDYKSCTLFRAYSSHHFLFIHILSKYRVSVLIQCSNSFHAINLVMLAMCQKIY